MTASGLPGPVARFRNDTWGDMSTFWTFELAGDQITAIATGQAR
jgi:hypothetical protein